MSTTVQVLFQGLVLWWTTAPGPYGVVPDFTASPNPHDAILRIVSSQYATGNCPAGFTSEGSSCRMSLNEVKKPGGVSMTFAAASSSSSLVVPDPSLCPIPKLQSAGAPLLLRPEFTPPMGERNAGWVRFEGGTLHSNSPCGDSDCARTVSWNTPVQEVTLTLGNLSNRNEPQVIPLPADARVFVSNNRGVGSSDAHAAEEQHRRSADTVDWCLYFSMVTNAAAEAIPCPGKPKIPACKARKSRGSGARKASTIACSNSQYP